MPRKEIQSQNAQFKKVRGLYREKNREKYAQTIVEGPQAVRELLSYQAALIRDVYSTERALQLYPELAQQLQAHDLYLHILPQDLFMQLSADAQGILAVANQVCPPTLSHLLQEAKLLLFALHATDPGNLGTIIRAADAFGAHGVITGRNSVSVTNPKVIRASVGSIFHLPILESQNASDFIAAAKACGFQVLAADAHSHCYLDQLVNSPATAPFDLTRPTVWLVGNEAHGFSAAERKLADGIVGIRMYGKAESLNVAMASAICLYQSAQIQASHTR